MRPPPLHFAPAATITLLITVLGPWCGCATPPSAKPTAPPCQPRCERDRSCAALDEALLSARSPLLACVARAGAKSDLATTHRCHRALRLIENARWLLKTVQGETGFAPPVYNAPVSRREFFCRIEALAAARTAPEVERRYIALVRAYP